MRLKTSPIPIGRTPGFFASGINIHAISDSILSRSVNSVEHNCFASVTSDFRKSMAALPNILLPNIRRHSSASRQDTPPAPLVIA